MGFFVVCVLKEAKTVISDKVVKVSPTDSFQFHDIFNAATNEQFESYGVQVFLRKPPEKWVYVEEGLEGDISMLFELKFTHIKFVLEATEASVQEPQGPNAFDLLMRNSQLVCLPEQRKEDTRRDLLYNDIIKLLQSKEVGWKSGTHSTLGKSFVERLTAALWYIDPHCTKFTERSLSLGEFFDGLNQYRHDQHYNLFYFTGRHAKYNLMRDKLEQLASSLELSAVQPWATNEQWCNITEEVFILTSSMQKYASNLEKINKSMKQIHLSDTPARHPANDLIVYTIDSCRKIDAQYKQLQDHLLNVDYYTEVDLESFLPKDAIQRYRYIKDLQIQFPVTLYRRQMRKNVLKKYSLVKTITPAILRILYYDLTGDAAVASNSISKELEERLRLMLELEDPSIICDLRQNNGFKGTKFDTFWNEMNAYFNENLPAWKGLQGVALVRDVMGPESETAFAKLDTLDEIRTAAKTNPTLQNDLRECIKRVQQLLEGRTERLVLHNEPIQCYNPADETTIDEFFNIILLIDQTLKISETTSDILSKKTHLQQFMKTHCRQRQYVFQIKKCGQSSCTICKSVQLPHDVFDSLDWLPDPIPSTVDKDHYAKFQTVYQSETTEQHRPTLITTIANSERASSSILVNTRVREFIQCFQCGRMRCLYSERALSAEDKIACQIAIDNWDYSCGSPLVPEDHILYNKVFVREKISCETPMELAYYSCRKSNVNCDVCYWCGHDNELAVPSESLKSKYKSLYPCCNLCRNAGKDIFVRGEIKTNTRAAKRRKINN
ncbi:uncharacterized protein OCT59_019163 [Rhizophagus irregularis]|uniref:uncharacterized protein n=1 Tax=Rhizophagus irregularis TaxID=588596 RepID=UPI00331B87F5|nr:hypothetical protein OCT59_019163 [Rhizophagus irregularis]